MTQPVFFIGDVAVDEYYRLPSWPTAGTKLDVVPQGREFGGMIANAAVVYAGYGEPAHFLWSMNGSPTSRAMLDELADRGVRTDHVAFDETLADSKTIILLVDGEHSVLIPALGLDAIELSDEAVAGLADARWVYTAMGDLRALRHAGAGAAEVIGQLRAAGTRLALDLDVASLIDGDGDGELVGLADLLFVNHHGFERFCAGRPAADVVAGLLAGNTAYLVVTRASQGCQVFHANGSVDVPGLDVEAIDVTGAGDTFGASFLHALNRTDDLALAASFANAAAARAVTATGARAGVASDAQVLEFMRHHGVCTPAHEAVFSTAPTE